MSWQPPPDEITLTLPFPRPKPFTLDASKSVVVVVDMENYFVKRGFDRHFHTIEGNQRLLAKAREAGVKIIYIQSLRSPDALEFTVFGRPLHIIEGTPDVEIVEEIAPLPGETVVQKRSHDPWNNTELEKVLHEAGLLPGETTALVTGVSAAVCARACALGFSHRDYMVLIPMDCTGAALEDEAMTYAQYRHGAYAYNIDFTLSTLVEFVPAGSERAMVLAKRAARA